MIRFTTWTERTSNAVTAVLMASLVVAGLGLAAL
jgi:hypothetical protein